MLPFGAALAHGVQSYPGEVIPSSKVRYTGMASWLGIVIVTLVPPYVTSPLPSSNSFHIFMFFAAYNLFATIFDHFFLIETKGLTYAEIMTQSDFPSKK